MTSILRLAKLNEISTSSEGFIQQKYEYSFVVKTTKLNEKILDGFILAIISVIIYRKIRVITTLFQRCNNVHLTYHLKSICTINY